MYSNKKVVLIGGGSGNAVCLRGLKKYTENITVIVTVADDGGSSGKIRNELHILPPGDIRNCIVALADEENIMAELMDFRFKEGFVRKQSFGNLVIAAMSKISGSFPLAVKQICDVLAVKGRVLPVTAENIVLTAKTSKGRKVSGESNIPKYCKRTKQKIEKIEIVPGDANPLSECIDAIEQADYIILSPGSLYTSLMPNLLVKGVSEALEKSRAEKYYLVNMTTQEGETDGFSISDHISAIEKHVNNRKIFDHVVYNSVNLPKEVYDMKSNHKVERTLDDISEEHRKKYDCIGLCLAKLENDRLVHNSDVFWNYLFTTTKE